MFKFLRKIKGQSTVEYAVLIVVVIGALLAMQQYLKRGLSGSVKSSSDQIGEQFSPGNVNYYRSVVTSSHTNEISQQGSAESRMLNPETTNMTSSQNIINVQYEYWG